MKATEPGSPDAATELARSLTSDRRLANPITIVQLGLGAWQLSLRDDAWLEPMAAVVDWLGGAMEPDGRVPFLFSMPHTFDLRPPWASSMAQGELASLLVRAAISLDRPALLGRARLAVAPLLDPASGLVSETDEGPVLQEYPTDPPAHVLNGWVFSLWGLYDVSVAADDRPARQGFERGVEALTARLPRYRVRWDWSRYDLYPHRMTHVTSPFYHRLHVEQLRALHQLAPRNELATTAAEWEAALRNPAALAIALARKAAFRAVNPRRPVI